MLIAPTADLLKFFHRIIIEIEGTQGYMMEGMIQGCIDRAMTYVYEFEPFPDVITKAAALMHSIIVFHPFIDGNKRTALLGTVFFLLFNGYEFSIPEDSVEFTIKIAEFKRTKINDIAAWIYKNSRIRAQLIFVNLLISFSIKYLKVPQIEYVKRILRMVPRRR